MGESQFTPHVEVESQASSPAPPVFGAPGPDRWKRWLHYLWPWLIPIFIETAQLNALYRSWDLPVSLLEELSLQFYRWYVYALLALYVMQLLHRVPLKRATLARGLALHGLAMLGFVAARSVLMALIITYIIGGYTDVPRELGIIHQIYTLKNMTVDALAYWLIVGAVQLRDTFRQQRAQELKTVQLQSQLANAQLSALKMQLHPHFLFNTLNAIAALVRTGETRGAVRMIVGLSELLRLTLDSQRTQVVRLEQELGFLDRYLNIELVRFSDRLTVERDIDPSLLDAMVPNLILQPLVENAICHGLAPRAGPGHLRISARREGDDLVLEVCDDGPGMPAGWSPEHSDGVGLSNTRARLQQLYGPRQRFEISTRDEGGTCGRITVPLTPAAPAEQD